MKEVIGILLLTFLVFSVGLFALILKKINEVADNTEIWNNWEECDIENCHGFVVGKKVIQTFSKQKSHNKYWVICLCYEKDNWSSDLSIHDLKYLNITPVKKIK